MPNCIVNECCSGTGRQGQSHDIILHPFPNDLNAITQWLLQTGQVFSNVELLAQNILDGKKTNKYRLCSKHFTSDSYIHNVCGRTLRPNALPSIFPPLEEVQFVIQENLTMVKRSHRKRQRPTSESSRSVSTDTCSVNIELSDASEKQFQSIATQTDFTLENSSVVFHQVLGCEGNMGDEVISDIETSGKGEEQPLFSTPNLETELQSPLKKKQNVQKSNIKKSLMLEKEFLQGTTPLSPLAYSADISIGENQKTNITEDPDYVPDLPSAADSDLFGFASLSFQEQLPMHGEECVQTINETVTERKLIVFESCLDNLFKKVKCQEVNGCKHLIVSTRKIVDGSYIKVIGTCRLGHQGQIFQSQPKIGNFAAGNILLASAILFSGLNFQKVHELLNIFGVLSISEKTFYRYQSKFLFPAIDIAWKTEQANVKKEIITKNIIVSGDGQCDSPGHSAKYCVYTVMDTISDKIIDFEVVQQTQCTSSVAMENYGFKVCMDRLLNSGFKIKIFASDRHVSIRSRMRKDYSDINHQFDVWHYAKSVKKKLKAASQSKLSKEITPWIDKIALHLWWSIKTCNDNVELLQEKWLSCLQHITNTHDWDGCNMYHQCSHGPLVEDTEDGQIFWLKKETPPYMNIQKIVTSPQLLKDLPHLVHNCHTGALENFHSLVLKYRPKRIHFGIDSMEARTKLAALTHNYNVGRQIATVKVAKKNTEAVGTKRTKIVFPKGKTRWIVRDVFDKVSVEYIEELSVNVLRLVKGELSSLWISRNPSMPPNISNKERPKKEDLKNQRIFRFKNI
ncbi:unnamed protein product [Ranitomeya imitator]|uniref:THAP-type domain-containing protein n=1 Tax=Ranitomeya imitator TaxID=111125 RepID=A0ABN9MFT4_9NEOB|nr:unnamed protein product [Ranitomeya imitator]